MGRMLQPPPIYVCPSPCDDPLVDTATSNVLVTVTLRLVAQRLCALAPVSVTDGAPQAVSYYVALVKQPFWARAAGGLLAAFCASAVRGWVKVPPRAASG